MNRSTKVAVIAVIPILAIIFAVGAFIILQPSESDDTSWVPTLDYYVTDDGYVLSDSDYNDLDQFCYAVEQNNTCQIAVLIVNGTDFGGIHVGVSDLALKVFEKNGIGRRARTMAFCSSSRPTTEAGAWLPEKASRTYSTGPS